MAVKLRALGRDALCSLRIFAFSLTHLPPPSLCLPPVTFRVYDVDNDGFISNADLYHVLKAMVGSNLNDVQLQQLVDRTIIQVQQRGATLRIVLLNRMHARRSVCSLCLLCCVRCSLAADSQGDKDKDGKLNYEEFKDMIKDGELEQKLKIDF